MTDDSPERVFDRRWVRTLLDLVITRLRVDATRKGTLSQFDALTPCLTGEEPHVSYAQIAADLAMSEGAVRIAAHRMRRRFRDLLREEIAQTVSSTSDIDDELRHLWSAVAG